MLRSTAGAKDMRLEMLYREDIVAAHQLDAARCCEWQLSIVQQLHMLRLVLQLHKLQVCNRQWQCGVAPCHACHLPAMLGVCQLQVRDDARRAGAAACGCRHNGPQHPSYTSLEGRVCHERKGLGNPVFHACLP